MKVIKRRTDEQLTELAREIVTGHTMVVDFSDRDWQASMALLISALADIRNLGMVVVPMGPHMAGRWLNGKVPGVTVSCQTVAKGDMKPLHRKIRDMNHALFPERE